MAASSNYPQFTKTEKSGFNSIKKAIFQTSQRLGIGASSPVPYDTAWVARVPKVETQSPAFPDSLQWLRDHQNKDGSWGAEYPPSLHSKILNTLVSVLAFSQWNYAEDEKRIKLGAQALERMAETLSLTKTDDQVFELILTSLLDDARELKLGITYKHFEFHSAIGKESLRCIERKIMSNKPNNSWTLLECAGGMELELEFYRSEITKNGLIAAQPSTTAFILRYARLRGEDFVEAEWALEKLYAENQGGIPHFASSDNFEIIYGLDFLLKADINPRMNSKYAAIQKSIDALKRRFDVSNGIGFSSNWPITDGECYLAASRVLSKVFNVNLDLNNNVWTTSAVCFLRKAYISSKRNVSLYYNMLQQVSEIKDDKSDELLKILDFLGRSQNSDGGWGGQSTSSAEETAYVCLAIYRLFQSKCEVIDKINFQKLVEFMNTVVSSQSHESFWYYKVNFRSIVLSEVVIACAKHVVFKIQRIYAFSEALDIFGIEYLEVTYSDKKNRQFYRALLPSIRPGEERQNIEVDKSEIEEACKSVLGVEHPDERMQKMIDESINFTYHWKNFRTPFEIRVHDALYVVSVLLIDEYYDSFLKGKKLMNEARQATKIASEILRGYHNDLKTLPDFNSSSLSRYYKWCSYCRKFMEKNKMNIEPFIELMEETGWFKTFVHAYKVEDYYGIETTSKQHLKIHKNDSGVVDSAQISLLSDGYQVDSTKFENDELYLKFRDCAAKAARCMFDVLSVQKDMTPGGFDNYCLHLMKEYTISLDEAMQKVTQKGNKEILKMYYLKKIMLDNPEKRENEKLALALEYIERCVHASIFWSIDSPRQVGPWKISTKKVQPETIDVRFTRELGFSSGDWLT